MVAGVVSNSEWRCSTICTKPAPLRLDCCLSTLETVVRANHVMNNASTSKYGCTPRGCCFTWHNILALAHTNVFIRDISKRYIVRLILEVVQEENVARRQYLHQSTWIMTSEARKYMRTIDATHFQRKWLFVSEAALVRQSRLIKRVTDFAISRHSTSKRGNCNLGSLWIYNVFSAATTFNRSCLCDW